MEVKSWRIDKEKDRRTQTHTQTHIQTHIHTRVRIWVMGSASGVPDRNGSKIRRNQFVLHQKTWPIGKQKLTCCKPAAVAGGLGGRWTVLRTRVRVRNNTRDSIVEKIARD